MPTKTKKNRKCRLTNVQLFLLTHAITNMVKSKSRKPSGNIWDTQLSEVEAEGLNVLMTKNNLKFVNGYVQVYSVDAELNMAFEKDAIDDIIELFVRTEVHYTET